MCIFTPFVARQARKWTSALALTSNPEPSRSTSDAWRRHDIQTELVQIPVLHLSIHTLGIAGRMFFQDGGERGSGVLDVHIDASGEQGLMTDIGAGQIEAPLDRLAKSALQQLRQQFAQDKLFGKVLGADGGACRRPRG